MTAQPQYLKDFRSYSTIWYDKLIKLAKLKFTHFIHWGVDYK
jgi:hypothetical protein